MNTNQIRKARALAHAFGHGWACADATIEGAKALDLAPTLDAAKAAWIRYARAYSDAYGAMHDPGLGPATEHRTATGRTRWTVDVNGLATITIARPTGDVIVAVVTTGGLVRIDVLGAHEARHVGALDVCLLALGVDDAEIARSYRVAGVNAAAVAAWAADAALWEAGAAERARLADPEPWVIEVAERARLARDRAAAIAAACEY